MVSFLQYVYQAAPPRPYTAFTPVQYSYGAMYGYTPAPNGAVQFQSIPPGAYSTAASTQQLYPMGSFV